MAGRGTSRSPHARGRSLVWLAVACSIFAALWVFYGSVFESGYNLALVLVPVVLTEAILIYGAIRRYSFARWGLVVALLSAGAFPIFLGLGALTLFSRQDLSVDYLIYPAAVLWCVSGLTLVFSQSVGDYFAFRQTHLAPESWDALSLQSPEHWVRDRSGSAFPLTGHPGVTVEDLGTEASERSTAAKHVRLAVLAIFASACVLALVSASVIAISNRHSAEESTKAAYASNQWLAVLAVPLIDVFTIIDIGVKTIGIYVAFFVLPFLVTLPFSLPLARRWHDPARFLLLRPFGTPRITPSLRRFLQQEVVPFGHCYTLADSAIRVPLHIRVPFLLGQLALFSFRARKLRSPRDLQRLAREMNRRVIRNLNWLLSRDRLFPITCSDFAWQPCVKAVVERADVILMDITLMTPNMLWELNLLRATEADSRTILLTHESRQPASHDETMSGVPIVAYGNDSATGAGSLAAAITKILVESRNPRHSSAARV
jgi:hypothetical protein